MWYGQPRSGRTDPQKAKVQFMSDVSLVAHPPSGESQNLLLISAKDAAALCGMSLRTWWRKDSAGHVPAAVRIGGGSMKRWRVEELRCWCEAGCPPRNEWDAMHQEQ